MMDSQQSKTDGISSWFAATYLIVFFQQIQFLQNAFVFIQLAIQQFPLLYQFAEICLIGENNKESFNKWKSGHTIFSRPHEFNLVRGEFRISIVRLSEQRMCLYNIRCFLTLLQWLELVNLRLDFLFDRFAFGIHFCVIFCMQFIWKLRKWFLVVICNLKIRLRNELNYSVYTWHLLFDE